MYIYKRIYVIRSISHITLIILLIYRDKIYIYIYIFGKSEVNFINFSKKKNCKRHESWFYMSHHDLRLLLFLFIDVSPVSIIVVRFISSWYFEDSSTVVCHRCDDIGQGNKREIVNWIAERLLVSLSVLSSFYLKLAIKTVFLNPRIGTESRGLRNDDFR